ncbi:4'-phosphopantetheinyl transferase family protein [Actinomadura scrupuli]|uniref:4'-phosphopantetheinyl transferase family protein n=1 Tax=Actinomadura scrupuli TaxID=559629 RepID=UPI003D991CEA
MIENILPPQVATAEAYLDPPGAYLFPAERELIRRSVDKRRREFTTVRWCARRAIEDLGGAPAPILHGERGAPLWPDGIVGSMTHCDGYRAAAVAHRADVLTIGIDAEPHAPLPEGVHESIALPAETHREDVLRRAAPDIHWDRLLFSAKESVYKAWFPLTHRWLGFEQADVVLRPDGGFSARLLTTTGDLAPPCFDGTWLVMDGLLVTAIALPPDPAPRTAPSAVGPPPGGA